MASNVRQERRRRIMDKGVDRMALITGQIKTLDASSTPTHSHHSHTESSPPIMFSPDHLASIDAGPDQDADKATGSKMVKLKTISEFPNSMNFDFGIKEEPALNKNLEDSEKTEPVFDTITKLEASNQLRFFSSKRLNHCIISTEKMRAICSLIIALLVVISRIDYHLNLVISESFIASRPFYMILLTDVTIVLGLLFRDSGNFTGEVENERMAGTKEDGDNWDGAVKLLERGLVMYQAIRGIFIDCSIYLVVVISGLSLIKL